MSKDKKPKMVKVAVKDINQLAFTVKQRDGALITARAGEVAFTMSQVEGCRVYFKNGLYIETPEPAESVNNMLNQCYQIAGEGFMMIPATPPAPPAEAPANDTPNRAERRAAAAKSKK